MRDLNWKPVFCTLYSTLNSVNKEDNLTLNNSLDRECKFVITKEKNATKLERETYL